MKELSQAEASFTPAPESRIRSGETGPVGRRVLDFTHRYVPRQFNDPVGLLVRLLATRDRAALFAIVSAGLGLGLSPLDWMLTPFERRIYRQAEAPKGPLVFVCGPPRSGTTLAEQVLLNHLPFGYFRNLTSIFPRSPVVAERMFGSLVPKHPVGYASYYGRTNHLDGPNDALYLWDRWLGSDRSRIRDSLSETERSAMRRFFGAYEALIGRPLLAKNNNLNVQAHPVAVALPQSWFICMTRDPVYLAQSLWRGRLEIHGSAMVPYGIDDPNRPHGEREDPLVGACRQALFHVQAMEEQQRRIGAERFWIVRYEDLCADPAALVDEVSRRILGQAADLDAVRRALPHLEPANRVRVAPELFRRIEHTLQRLRAEPGPRGG